MPDGLTADERRLVASLVERYSECEGLIDQFQESLVGAIARSTGLMTHIHSLKSRLKEPDRLRAKLIRKIRAAKEDEKTFEVSPETLLTRVNDLAGIRLLHLYTRQIRDIDRELRLVLDEQQYALLEGPFARTWDDESRAFFKACGISTQDSPSMYTSVHYVVSSASKTQVTCEIQVRTLMEEVWGEVDHTINYPDATDSVACGEQLKALARVTSGATRLVDSIFQSLEDHAVTKLKEPSREGRTRKPRRRPKPTGRKPRAK